MKKISFGVLLFFFTICQVNAQQPNSALNSVQHYVSVENPKAFDSSYNDLHFITGNNLHYLYPAYQLMGQKEKFIRTFSYPLYYDLLSQTASFLGDYSAALDYQHRSDTIPPTDVELRQIAKSIQQLKNIKHVDARRYINFVSSQYRVIMLNEAYNKPLHRAFALTMLDDLYNRGFRYLAMEMLNPMTDQELTKVTYKTGHFATEPVAGEMIRHALDLGYKLVAYEDPYADRHSATERDSIEAVNLAKILKADPDAKMLVYAGYGRIAKKASSPDYTPMGVAFKRISGIDALSIDQTDMTEESNFPFGKAFYDAYMEKFPVTSPSIALDNDKAVNVTGTELYDLAIIHPKTIYMDARPTWLGFANRRRPTYIKTTNRDIFLVQAYYQYESKGMRPGEVVPADQSYFSTGKGYYTLYLRRGLYILIFKDLGYKTLYTQHLEVN